MMLLPILAFAAQATAATPAAVSPQPAPSSKPKMICETIEETGSRLGSKRICRSREDWEKLRQDSRMSLEMKQRTEGPSN